MKTEYDSPVSDSENTARPACEGQATDGRDSAFTETADSMQAPLREERKSVDAEDGSGAAAPLTKNSSSFSF